jgi:hypothetical protein
MGVVDVVPDSSRLRKAQFQAVILLEEVTKWMVV